MAPMRAAAHMGSFAPMRAAAAPRAVNCTRIMLECAERLARLDARRRRWKLYVSASDLGRQNGPNYWRKRCRAFQKTPLDIKIGDREITARRAIGR